MKAFIVVDVQNDFCPDGALGVKHGDEVVPFVNRTRQAFPLTVFTQDWHPQGHSSFASNNAGAKVGEVIKQGGIDQIMWPDHCVQNTRGAEFHADLAVLPADPVFRRRQIRCDIGRILDLRHLVRHGTVRSAISVSETATSRLHP